MHVKEVDSMGGFVTIEHALLDHNHPIPIGTPIDDTGAYTAAGALTTGYEGINAQIVQVSCQRRTPESARGGFTQNSFPRPGSDLINNIVSALPPVTGFRAHLSGL